MSLEQANKAPLLEVAHGLAGRVSKVVDRIDRDRELPEGLANSIADAGFFRLLVPKSVGGIEIDYLDFLSVVDVFARIDGSTAWCITQNNVFATVAAFLSEETAKTIWSDQRAVVTNGPPAHAEATAEDGGYRLSGKWNFSSGFPQATWLAAIAPIQPESSEQTDETEVRTMIFPKRSATPLDVWQVNGLRGTGSLSFEVKDLYVPNEWTFGDESPWSNVPLYVIPKVLLFASGFATVALGVSRSALDVAIDLLSTKRLDSRVLLRDRSAVQREIGEAEAMWSSAQSYLQKTTESVWESACKDNHLTTEERVQLRLASTHVIRQAAEVVDIAYQLCGSDAIFTANPIQRPFQDVHAITQQIQSRMSHYETAGQFFLGLELEEDTF